MGDISIAILLAFVSVLLTINLYILKALRDDLKEGIKKLWEKIDAMVEKYDSTVERIAKMEVEVNTCLHKWDKRHSEE